jgi:hypothetical protein
VKFRFAFGYTVAVAAFLAIPVQAQVLSSGGALGGKFASPGIGRPLGGVPLPGSPSRNTRAVPRKAIYGGVPYAYSFYVPNYFDNPFSDVPVAPYAPPYPVPYPAPYPAATPATPAPPVIINQYFSGTVDRPAPQESFQEAGKSAPGDPIGPAESYYLIAYKNHSVYAALAYWVEDKTLHYVTTQNTHNQASLDLIDTELTKNLNEARKVPFSLPNQ